MLPQLSDFGMSCKLGPERSENVVRSYGAVTHMAPEVLTEHRVGYKADVWSLGVIMWQVRCGAEVMTGKICEGRRAWASSCGR
jgi:serine/threonine protein kinase